MGGGNTLQLVLANKVTELRATYASIPDALSGRMPLAYTQVTTFKHLYTLINSFEHDPTTVPTDPTIDPR